MFHVSLLVSYLLNLFYSEQNTFLGDFINLNAVGINLFKQTFFLVVVLHK